MVKGDRDRPKAGEGEAPSTLGVGKKRLSRRLAAAAGAARAHCRLRSALGGGGRRKQCLAVIDGCVRGRAGRARAPATRGRGMRAQNEL